MTSFAQRLAALQKALRERQWQGYLVTQNVDLYYFTGSMQNGYLFVPAEGKAVFYVKRSVERAKQEAACDVRPLGSFREFSQSLKEKHPDAFRGVGIRFATEFDVLPTQLYLRLQQMFPHVEWVDGSRLVRELRMIKSPEEIERIRYAAEVTDRAFQRGLSVLREGMSELELVLEIERQLRIEGHAGIMRMRGYNQEIITGMVASGASAAIPTYFDGPAGGLGLHASVPQGASREVIERGEPILIDIGCCIDGYVIDQTRTAVIGQLAGKHLEQAYALSEQILQQTEHSLKPGTSCEGLYQDALATAEQANLGKHFMGYGADQVKFLGHGIGLEIDELPVLARGFAYPLQPGMVIAIEPKFSFPGEGVVGVEDTYAITSGGFERLTLTERKLFEV
ncbi:aminopeptidase P family protein [Xylanibacillus composti]|uniref:Peptidase M24 n=1 Tax=Xylanibacillus composti TaxID=1572762 RepID=A0A8J4H914_9BACL|nr:Xaa-Pro peptidase family protein [Xylanibacillus composti]MDT9723676.1 aminopeptidase P family protein [Xylanibacillus composti]GIQ71013.1 peptidase M24 [Xylanibacillus composti]